MSDGSAAIPAAVPPSGTSVEYATSAAYDALNRPTGVSWTPTAAAAAATGSGVTFGHTYNKANQRVSQTVTDNSRLSGRGEPGELHVRCTQPIHRRWRGDAQLRRQRQSHQ